MDWYYIPPTHPSAVPGPEETAALAVYLLNLTGVLLAELATHARRRAKRFLQGPVFAENDDAFAELFFDAELGTVCWPNGADIRTGDPARPSRGRTRLTNRRRP